MAVSDISAPDTVRALNDRLRREGVGGALVITSGLRALGADAVVAILMVVASFDAFTPENDPYGEHDFCSVEVAGENCFFKIDAYDRDLRYGSPDPSDPSVTTRVMTVMLAREY